MKAYFHKVPLPFQSSFSFRHDVNANFGTLLHYHSEWELHYVVKGRGVRLIGDNISNFTDGELILIDGSIPHAWICSKEYFDEKSKLKAEAIVIHFHPNNFGQTFLELPEIHLFHNLYKNIGKGMLITGETKERLIPIILKARYLGDMDRLIALLTILNLVSQTTEYEPITLRQAFRGIEREGDSNRLKSIYDYTLSNFRRQISIEEIAEISNLTSTSFCRYFKLMTKKTYFDFLSEVRISHACRLLVEDKLLGEHVSDECGFPNKSSFYRNFKIVTGMTPLEYKRLYSKKMNTLS